MRYVLCLDSTNDIHIQSVDYVAWLCSNSFNVCDNWFFTLGTTSQQNPVVKHSCPDNPCVSGQGECKDGIDTWVCICNPGYSGRFCEVRTNSSINGVSE